MTLGPCADILEPASRVTAITSGEGICLGRRMEGGQPRDILVLSLAGTFRLRTRSGIQIPITGEYPKRLIAILARSPGMSRSRDQLIDLLWDASKDPASSLRQLRHQLSHMIGPHGASITACGNVLTLEGVTDETGASAPAGVDFFEDAGFGTEAFEDWLRVERMAFTVTSLVAGPQASRLSPARRPRPRLGLLAPVSSGIDTRGAVVGDWISTSLRNTFIANDFVDFSDLRQGGFAGSDLDAVSEVRVTQMGAMMDVAIAAFTNATRQCLFSQSLTTRADRTFSPNRQDVAEFIVNATSGIERAMARLARFDMIPWHEAPLYELVTRMFRMTRTDVLAATEALESFESEQNPASVLAWRGFGKMLLNGERLTEDRAATVAEAGALIARALETDPMNPTALSVAAHHASYVLRDFECAAELSDASLRIAPHSPFARDVRATLEIYAGNIAEGARQAQLAASFAQNGPLRHYVEGSIVIAATLSGQHDTAVRKGREILRARPHFLPVMRHLFASLALRGDIGEARDLLTTIQELDPAFGTDAMGSPDYGLPSQESRRLVTEAVGIINKGSGGGGNHGGQHRS